MYQILLLEIELCNRQWRRAKNTSDLTLSQGDHSSRLGSAEKGSPMFLAVPTLGRASIRLNWGGSENLVSNVRDLLLMRCNQFFKK